MDIFLLQDFLNAALGGVRQIISVFLKNPV